MTQSILGRVAADTASVLSAGPSSIDWDGECGGAHGAVWDPEVLTHPPNKFLEAVHPPYAASSKAVREQAREVSEMRLRVERQSVGTAVGMLNLASAGLELKRLRDRCGRHRVVAVAKLTELLCINRGRRIVELDLRCEAARAPLWQAKDLQRKVLRLRADNLTLRTELSDRELGHVREGVVAAQLNASYTEDSPVISSPESSLTPDGSMNRVVQSARNVPIYTMKRQLRAERELWPHETFPKKLSTSVADLQQKYRASISRVGKL